MQKIVTLVCREPSLGMEQFRAGYLALLASASPGERAKRDRCIVNFVDVPPQESGLDPATTLAPAYDAVLEIWCAAPEDYAHVESLHAGARALVARAFAYHVREVVQKEYARTWPAGERSPGIKGIYAVIRSAKLTPAEFERHWRQMHGPLALTHHVGLSKYVQDVVLRPLTPGAPAFDGFSELHFPTSRDLRERFVDSPEGGRRIEQDVAKFVASAVRLDASEYVLDS